MSERLASRRDFLHAGIAAAAIATLGCASPRREGIPEAGTSGTPTSRPSELEEATVAELQAGMESGRFTARSLIEMYLARIEAVDRQGPAVNAVIELNPDALASADSLDNERRANRVRGPLHGIPVLVKDNIDTAGRMSTTAGSLALARSIARRDSFVAEKLREAGAVILGKTNLSEWANIRSTRSVSGWSARGGQTRNPYALDRNPCGSSSGSGVAVTASLCAVAIGTETDGSIVCPASANSIVGIKPTVGLVSRSGIIPISHSQDTAGPMARTVADAAVLLGALTGVDPRDSVTEASRGRVHADYREFLDPNGLKGARIGVARNFFGFNARVDQLMEEAIEEMKRLGAVLVDPADVPNAGTYDNTELEVLLWEFKAGVNRYLAALGPEVAVHSLKDVIEFNERNREKEMPYFGQDLFLRAEEKGPLTSSDYLSALRRNHALSRSEGIDMVMTRQRLDAIVGPTGAAPWPTDLINGDHFTGGCSTPAAVAGYPHVTVPAGYVFGLPVGISFFAGPYSEPTLIKLAYAFEKGTKLRQPPRFLATAELPAAG